MAEEEEHAIRLTCGETCLDVTVFSGPTRVGDSGPPGLT